MSDAILTTAELAEKLGLSPQTVRRMANAGQLPGLKSGRDYRFLWEAVKAELRHPRNATIPTQASEDEHVLTTAGLADRLRLSAQTIRRMANNGLLPVLKTGKDFRFSWQAIKETLWQPITLEDTTEHQSKGAGFRAQRQAHRSEALDD